MINVDLNKLSGNMLLFWFLLIMTTVSCGAFFIFAFKYDLFIELEIVKLILLSSAFALPIFLFNCLIFAEYDPSWRKFDEVGVPYYLMTLGAIPTTMFLYGVSLVRLFFVFSINIAIISILIFQLLVIYSIISDHRKQNKNSGDAKLNSPP